jgi:hypothetical protein
MPATPTSCGSRSSPPTPDAGRPAPRLDPTVSHLSARCYTAVMPTARPRHVITETDDVAAALADADRAWPDAHGNKTALIRRLVQAGHASLRGSQRATIDQRLEQLDRAAGSLTGLYDPDYLHRLREDWPA